MARAPTRPGLLPLLKLWIFLQAQHICEYPIRTGNTERKLTIKGIRVVDISALSVTRVDESPFLGVLLGIVSLEQRLILFIPGNEKLRSAFFDPPIKILRCDHVGPCEERIFGIEDGDNRFLIGHFFWVIRHHVGIWTIVMVELRRIVLHN